MTEIEIGIAKPEEQKPMVQTVARPGKAKKEDLAAEFKLEPQTLKYSDVIGMKRAKAILHKLLELPLKKPEEFKQLGVKRSVGILLYGPPGIGKTLLAKAVCGELNLKMCYVDVGKVLQKYVGESPKQIIKVFELARANQPCVLFFDEADRVLRDRDKIDNERGSSEEAMAITQMLMEVSKVHDDATSHVYLIGATNRPMDIDPAHKRSGRFEYLLYVGSPGFWDRRQMLKYYIKKGTANAEKFGHINYTLLAFATARMSGADLEKIVKISKINSIEKEKVLITTRSVQKALWSKEGGKSSLDEFYITMFHRNLPPHKSFWKSLVSKAYKQKELPKGKFDKADMELYGEMINDVKAYMRDKWFMRVSRVFGRGMPVWR